MIKVEGISKRFAGVTAVDDISFEVARGEVLGFLGPNAAGKTTTMRMITTFLPPSNGKISVGGYHTVLDSLKVRRLVGYMPESVPFYNEMRVSEYLSFRAKIKGVARGERKNRIAEVVEQCRIKEVAHKIIGYLSKGYRQRVALAEAIIHNPEILILDEPTIGLDPHQIRQTRELIKELGKNKTIILSTHILPEVEMICNRVIIIHQGRIVAMDTLDQLTKKAGEDAEIRLEVKGPREEIEKVLGGIPGINRIICKEAGDINSLAIFVRSERDIREDIYQKITEHKWVLRELHLVKRTLEDLFVKITAED